MKKYLALIMALVMVFALCACGQPAAPAAPAEPAAAPAEPAAEAPAEPAAEAPAVPTSVEEAKAMGRKIIIDNNHNSKDSTNGQFTMAMVNYFNEHSTESYIDAYFDAALGDIVETLEGAVMGTIDLGGCSFAQFKTYCPDIEIWAMPYLYTNPEDGAKVVDLEKNTLLAEQIERCNDGSGVTIIGCTYSIDARQLTCNFPVYSPADLNSQKIRCMPGSDVYAMLIEGMGGIPFPLGWADTIPALNNNTCVGEENPYATLVSYSMWDCQKYVMETNHMFDFGVTYMCTDTWNALSDADKQIMRDAIQAQQDCQNEILTGMKEEYKQTLIDNGMTIITAEDGLKVDEFKSAVDALKVKNYPQYAEQFAYIDELIAG